MQPAITVFDHLTPLPHPHGIAAVSPLGFRQELAGPPLGFMDCKPVHRSVSGPRARRSGVICAG
jgi:hypothetical protein